MATKNINEIIKHVTRRTLKEIINENAGNINPSAQNVFNKLYMIHRELNKMQRDMMLNSEPEDLIEIAAKVDQMIQNVLNTAPQLKGLYYQPN